MQFLINLLLKGEVETLHSLVIYNLIYEEEDTIEGDVYKLLIWFQKRRCKIWGLGDARMMRVVVNWRIDASFII